MFGSPRGQNCSLKNQRIHAMKTHSQRYFQHHEKYGQATPNFIVFPKKWSKDLTAQTMNKYNLEPSAQKPLRNLKPLSFKDVMKFPEKQPQCSRAARLKANTNHCKTLQDDEEVVLNRVALDRAVSNRKLLGALRAYGSPKQSRRKVVFSNIDKTEIDQVLDQLPLYLQKHESSNLIVSHELANCLKGLKV